MDEHVPLQQQVEMFTDWAGQGIFDRNHRAIGAPGIESFEDLYRPAAGDNFCLRHKLNCRLVAECSSLTLDRNSHAFQYTLEQLSIF